MYLNTVMYSTNGNRRVNSELAIVEPISYGASLWVGLDGTLGYNEPKPAVSTDLAETGSVRNKLMSKEMNRDTVTVAMVVNYSI